MKKTILEIYALAVCFAAVVCFVIAAGVGLYALIGVVKPELTLPSWEYDRHRDNDIFWDLDKPPQLPMAPGPEVLKQPQRPPEEELTRRREQSLQHAIRAEQRNRLQTVLQTSIVLLLNMVIFAVHWRIASHARAEQGEA